MNSLSEQQLLACLDLMEQGVSVADILARYPKQAEELRPYLETTTQLAQLATNPTIAQKLASQNAFLAQAAALKAAPLQKVGGWLWLRRVLFPIAALSLFLIIFGTGLVTASASALPGDGLYAIKRQVEGFQLQTLSASADKLALIEQFKTERQREVAALLSAGRKADVQFEGVLESLGANSWVVSNITTEIAEQTVIDGTPHIEALVRVTGFTENGRLTATRIQILTSKPSEPVTPEAEPTETARPTSTASPAATLMPSNTPTATETAVPTATNTPTNTPTPTSTIAPTASPTPEPQPTAVPTQDQPDDNDNSEDNGDDNNNDNNDNGEDNDNSEDNDNRNDNDEDNDNSEDNISSDDNDNTNDNSSNNDNG